MILVTGGTGLVGSHLLCELTQRNEFIRASYHTEIKKEETRKLFEFYFQEKAQEFFSKIEWVKADILSITSLNDSFFSMSAISCLLIIVWCLCF